MVSGCGVRACRPRRGGSLVAAAFARSGDGWLLLLRLRRTALWRIAPVQREWLVALMRLPRDPAVTRSDPGTLPASNVKLLRKAGPAELGGGRWPVLKRRTVGEREPGHVRIRGGAKTEYGKPLDHDRAGQRRRRLWVENATGSTPESTTRP